MFVSAYTGLQDRTDGLDKNGFLPGIIGLVMQRRIKVVLRTERTIVTLQILAQRRPLCASRSYHEIPGKEWCGCDYISHEHAKCTYLPLNLVPRIELT